MKTIAKVALVMLLLEADKQKPIAEGPQYDLGRIPESRKQTGVAMTVVDARPSWQRYYYVGSTDARRSENAVTFIPLDSFHASPLSHVKWECVSALREVSNPPARVRLRITSFHVVINEVSQL